MRLLVLFLQFLWKNININSGFSLDYQGDPITFLNLTQTVFKILTYI